MASSFSLSSRKLQHEEPDSKSDDVPLGEQRVGLATTSAYSHTENDSPAVASFRHYFLHAGNSSDMNAVDVAPTHARSNISSKTNSDSSAMWSAFSEDDEDSCGSLSSSSDQTSV